jgi:hypothetical protein
MSIRSRFLEPIGQKKRRNNMFTNNDVPRLLGAAFLVVIVTSLISGIFLATATGSGSISDMLINISNHITLMHIGVLGGLLNSVGIVFLAVLLYAVLKGQNKILALAALGLWLAEAVFYAIMQIGALALIPLSQSFVNAGAPTGSFYQALGDFLFNCVYNQGLAIHMWFYCFGGLIWYYLFYRSGYIPRAISLFGLLAVLLALIGEVFLFLGYNVPFYISLPILPFELIIGVWLLLRGIKDMPEKQSGDKTWL